MINPFSKKKKVHSNVRNFVAEKILITGTVRFSGNAQVNGQIKGEIITKDVLLVAETAIVHADILAKTVICRGKIRGNVIADSMIDLRAPGKIDGNLTSPSIIMQEGATVSGQCKTRQVLIKDQEGRGKEIVKPSKPTI